jgi:tetratricopeptide (TPR) repeat protein
VKRSNIGPRLDHAGMVQVMQQSRLSLAMPGNYHPHPLPMIKFRNLEVAACGSVALQEQHPDIDRQLTPMVDYWPYRDLDDAVVQIKTALANPDRLITMGRQAAAKVRQAFTWSRLWPRIEADLTARGFAPSPWQDRQPDAASQQALAIANLGLAHACEARGQTAVARSYFHDVLADAPEDQSALAGLARLAEAEKAPVGEVIARWEKARGQGPSRSFNMDYGATLGLPGLGGCFFTDPTADAAVMLFRHKGAAGDLLGAAAEAPRFAPHFDTALLGQARLWGQKGFTQAALSLYDALLALYPDREEWRREADTLRQRPGGMP